MSNEIHFPRDVKYSSLDRQPVSLQHGSGKAVSGRILVKPTSTTQAICFELDTPRHREGTIAKVWISQAEADRLLASGTPYASDLPAGVVF